MHEKYTLKIFNPVTFDLYDLTLFEIKNHMPIRIKNFHSALSGTLSSCLLFLNQFE